MIILQLFACFCLYEALPTLAQDTTKKCTPNEVVSLNLENQYQVKISELDLSVAFDRLDILGETSAKNVTELLLQSADVVVEGRLYLKENDTDSEIARSFKTDSIIVKLSEEKTTKRVSCKVSGREYSTKRQARSRNSLTSEQRIEFVLHGLIESCLEIQICEYLNSILSNHYVEKSESEPTVTYKTQRLSFRKLRSEKEKSLQNALNALFDFGVSAGITKLVDDKGILHLPEIKTDFTAAGSTGDFTASDGTFEGLTTIRRTKDVNFSNDKNHYTLGTTVRLSKAKVHLPSYHGRYGIINIYGYVILDIKGASLTMEVSVDYNSAPCKVHLNEMDIHDVGDIDVDISGLGWPLNNILEPVIRNIVRTTAFTNARATIAEKVEELNCEKYRPAIEIMKTY